MQVKLAKSATLESSFQSLEGLEKWREYVFPNGSVYRITHPTAIHVTRKEGGDSHRIIDALGVRHYIPSGWVAFRFEGKWGVS